MYDYMGKGDALFLLIEFLILPIAGIVGYTSHGDSPLGITAVYFAMIFLHLYICHQIFSFLVIFSRWDSTRYNRRPQNYSSKFGDLNKRLYLCNRKM